VVVVVTAVVAQYTQFSPSLKANYKISKHTQNINTDNKSQNIMKL
jgi:hypothetical protein